jgi:AraC-like DNA-binding protein
MKDSAALCALQEAVRVYAERHANAHGIASTPIAGLAVKRRDRPSALERNVCSPFVILVLQGAKRLSVGRSAREFKEGECAIIGVHTPASGRIVRASVEKPFLAIAIDLDLEVLRAVSSQMPAATVSAPPRTTLFSLTLNDDVIGSALRLMRLVDHPAAVPVVRPAIMQELHYWLLASAHGEALRQLTLPDSRGQQISRAIEFIRKRFREPIGAGELAAEAAMSPSAFRRHFKAVTSFSPLQFQKELRLIDARRLMLTEGKSAKRAAAEVGYESISQFSREYVRMFGSPPRADIGGRVRLQV